MYSPKYLLHRLMGVDIVKVFSLNAIATLIRMLSGMISVKVVAIIIGPAGIALLGQLNNINSILLGFATGGINAGITKYVAEYKKDEDKIKKYLTNALRIILLCTFFIALALIIGCKFISQQILMTDEYYYVFIIFGFTIFFYTLNTLLLSILNGYKKFKKYVVVNICGTILGLIYSILLVSIWGLPGAMINAVTFQSIMVFVTLWMCRDMPWLNKVYFKGKWNLPIVKQYFGFSLMYLTAVLLLPLTQMFLRGYVIMQLSAADAGIWEGMNRISNMYLGVITTAFGIYYLPRISEIKKNDELHDEVFRCYKVIVPMLLCATIVIYLLRHFILWLLFTPEFHQMEELFVWQLMGDFFKISSWLLAYIMVAKAKTVMYITTEILFSATYVLISFFFLRTNGIVGLCQGYMFNYIIYMIAMAFLFKNIIIVKK